MKIAMEEDVSSRTEWCEVKDLHGPTEILRSKTKPTLLRSVPVRYPLPLNYTFKIPKS